jgi:hypothetical protein
MKSVKKLILQQSSTLDKSTWNRKYENLQKLVVNINQLSDEIMQIEIKKLPLIDEITALRGDMIRECYHPSDYLVEKEDGTVECKFCGKTISVLDFD